MLTKSADIQLRLLNIFVQPYANVKNLGVVLMPPWAYLMKVSIFTSPMCGPYKCLGGTQYKRPYGDVPPTWVAKSTSWYMNDSILNENFGICMDWFFNIFPKFKNILEKSGDFAQIWLKIGQFSIWMCHFFLKILVFIWVYFLILQWRIPTKTNLGYPPQVYDTRSLSICCTQALILYRLRQLAAVWS